MRGSGYFAWLHRNLRIAVSIIFGTREQRSGFVSISSVLRDFSIDLIRVINSSKNYHKSTIRCFPTMVSVPHIIGSF